LGVNSNCSAGWSRAAISARERVKRSMAVPLAPHSRHLAFDHFAAISLKLPVLADALAGGRAGNPESENDDRDKKNDKEDPDKDGQGIIPGGVLSDCARPVAGGEHRTHDGHESRADQPPCALRPVVLTIINAGIAETLEDLYLAPNIKPGHSPKDED